MGLGPNPPISISSDASEMSDDEESEASPSSMDTDEKTVPQVYKGHTNSETVKGVNFFGTKCEYVVSGSDCGRIFIWKRKGGELIRVMKGDRHVVNCIESHLRTMVLASSGIENDIKMWTPKALKRVTLPQNIDQVSIPARLIWYTIGDDEDEDDEYSYDDYMTRTMKMTRTMMIVMIKTRMTMAVMIRTGMTMMLMATMLRVEVAETVKMMMLTIGIVFLMVLIYTNDGYGFTFFCLAETQT